MFESVLSSLARWPLLLQVTTDAPEVATQAAPAAEPNGLLNTRSLWLLGVVLGILADRVYRVPACCANSRKAPSTRPSPAHSPNACGPGG